MRTLFIFALIVIAKMGLTQTNIISNGGFENVYPGYPWNGEYRSDEPFPKNVLYWEQMQGWTYFSLGSDFVCNKVPSADVIPSGFESGPSSHFGDYLGFCDAGEYLLNSITTMQTDHIYYIECYVRIETSSLDSDNSVGLRFYVNRPRICDSGNSRPKPEGVAHLTVNESIEVGNWVRHSFIYKPSENYNWVSLGDFANKWNDRHSSFWDDIKILDLGTGLCPDHWIWENTVFDDEHYLYQASDFIYAGYDYDSADVYGPVIVKSNSEIIFRAANHIDLDTGFFTEPGSYFETEITGCEVDPCPWPAPMAGNYFFCDSLPHNIGLASTDIGLFFGWSPADHLNHDTAANPLFTAPAHDVGRITYIVTQTSICGGFFSSLAPFFEPSLVSAPSVTSQVTVGWDSDPSPNPNISLSNISTGDYSFSFDAQTDEHTEKVCVNFLESGTNNVIGPVCLYRFDDFDCCSFTFTYESLPESIMEQLSVCHDYTVLVSAKNFCFDTTATDSFAWVRNHTLSLTVPNIITVPDPDIPYSNGLNDEFCITVAGADNYHIVVTNIGNEVHESSGPVIYNPMCIWNGHCTAFWACTSPYLATGSYAVIVEVWNDCDPDTVRYNDYVVIAYDQPEKMMLLQADGAATPGAGEINIYPNPANDKVFVQLPNTTQAKISLFNGMGQVFGQYAGDKTLYEISTAHLQNGVYVLRVEDAALVKEFKIIITH